MASIWDDLGTPTPNPEAGSKGPGPAQSGSIWDIPAPDVASATPQKRGILGAANDYAIEAANAVLQLPKAALDFATPGSKASEAIGGLIAEGESKQSDVVKAAKARLAQSMQSESLTEQAKGAGKYVLENPLLAASQAVGSFVGPGFAIKGGAAIGGALGLAERGAARAGLGSGMATTGVLAGGDAAGDAYQTVMNSPSLVDKPIEERERLATKAAREASAVPFVIGAASGAFGAEKAFAMGTKSLIKTGAQEFAGEFIEEGGTKLSANLAAKQYAPEVQAMSGVVGSAVLGGMLGGGTGLAVGALAKQPDSFLPGSTNISTGEMSPDLNAINKAIDGNSSEIGPTAQGAQVNIEAIQQQQTQLEEARAQAKQEADAVAVQNAQEQAQVQEQAAKQSFIDTAKTYGVQPLPDAVGQFNVAGKRLFSTGQVSQFLQGIDQLNADKSVGQKELIGAAIASGNLKVAQTANPKAVNNAAIKFLDSWGFGDATDKVEAAQRAETLIKSLEGPKALKEADQLNSFYKTVTGQDSPAYVALQQAAQPLAKGTPNEQLQLQTNAGIREVPVQSGAAETSGTGTWDVRPTSVQPIGAGSVGERPLSLQTGSLPSVGVPTSTSQGGSRIDNAPNVVQAQEVTSDRQEALTVVNQVIVKAFGSRNADIILAVLTQEKSQAEIAKDFGISDARVNQIAGPQAQETWGPRILLAARNMGISKDEMGNLLEVMSREEAVAEEQVVNEELLAESPTEATSAQNVDDTNIATSDENLTLGTEELSKEEGPSGFRVFNPEISGATELEDASAQNRTRRKLKTTELEKLKDFELNNLAADENTTVEELDSIVAELLRRQEVRVNKGAPSAIQKPSTKKVPVRKRAGSSEAVGEGNAEEQQVTRARQEGETDEEAGAKAWNEGVKDFPDAPKFEELTAEQQEDWVSFGEENWTPDDVQTELIKLAKESATGKAQFSRNEGAGKDETWDADGLTSLLKQMFVANKNFDNLVSVVADYDELPTYVKNAVKKSSSIQAFVYGRRVYMLANQIQIGQELPVFLHEVGVHLGMENLLGTSNYRKLAGQVMTWSNAKGDAIEVEVAKAAKKRVDEAVADAKANGEPLTADEQLDEMLAYFVEEAVARGIDPTAVGKDASQVAQWFRSLMAALKVALRKVGFGKFDKLSAGNIVDLAFGAAKMEISGAYHGTAAEFRNFRTSQIGTGEGAVAYGWGLYMAERFGIAFDYMRSDVKRKAEAEGASYKGRTILALGKASSRGALTFQERAALEVLRRAKRDNEAFGITAPAGDFISLLIKERQYTMNTETDKGLIAGEKVMIDALKKLDPKDFTEAVNKPGSVMRVLPMADEDSLMDLDTRLAAQPEVLQKIKDGFPQEVLDAIDDKSNLELGDMTGRDLQIALVDLENRGIIDLYFQMPDSITDTIKQGRFMSEAIVSKYLEYKLGIEGVKYFDASSRSLASDVSIYKLPLLQKLKDRIIDQFTSGKLKAFDTGPVVVKGAYITKYVARAGSASNAPTSLTMIITSVGNFSAKQLGFSEQEIKDLTENIKDVQGRQQTKNVVMFKDKGVSRVATFPGAVKDGKVKFSLTDKQKTKPPELVKNGNKADLVVDGKVVSSFEVIPEKLYNAFKNNPQALATVERQNSNYEEANNALDKAITKWQEAQPLNRIEQAYIKNKETVNRLIKKVVEGTATKEEIGEYNEAEGYLSRYQLSAVRQSLTTNKPKFSLKKARENTAKQIDKLPKPIRNPLQHLMDNIYDFAKKGLPYFSFTEDLADMAAKYVPSAKKYVNLMKERQAIRTKFERQVDQILQKYDAIPDSVKGTGENSVNKFLMDSTRESKWAYNPGWIKDFDETKNIDPDLQNRFDALPVEAQNLVKEVFAHGHSTLLAMQKAVTDNINTEYDALIEAANKAGDANDVADLTKKKVASLTEYTTLMRTNSKKPYAPLKRFGNYVVVGKSEQYRDAEKLANSKDAAPDVIAEARKKVRELETNDMHYFVQFAETAGEAKAIVREEAKNYPYIEDFEKDTSHNFGGSDMNSIFHRLRNMAEESKDASITTAAEKAMNRLLADLKLTLLSEQSARQSERRRKNIGGAEKDMMRAFATQGRATASFIASLENTGDIYDTLREMKAETDAEGGVGSRGDRRKYYNEFMKRHFMGMDYQPSPFIDKALSVTSMWMLLTNPSYYLQNMTQPFMMSLPVMGGKHGYARSWKEMTRAYMDIAGVIRKHGLGESSYAKLPEDVRNVVEELVNRGRIDISLEQDLGRWRSAEEAKLAKFGRATELLRSMAQDIETINRVATAVAAYRLEVKGSNPTRAMNYADKIIYTTHGDYSGFNAPRITRQGIGRLATQFRKFQLIQISLMARLYNDAFQHEDADTRLIGKKALAYTLGHTAVMGGIMGLPGFMAIAALYGMLFGDKDEPDNPELALRRAIGDDTIADLLVKGVPAALGVDVSGKLGMGQMLSILPYTDIKFTRKELPQAGYALLTGPFGGLTLKAADAVGYMGSGDYQKGLEQLLPTGLANLSKAQRFASEGVTTKAGDVVIKPEEIGGLDAFMVALGLPTSTITDRNFLNAAKFQYDQFYNDRASEIKQSYTRAYKEGDNAALQEARDEWKNLQESRAKNGYTKQPLSTLLKAPQEQKKRERNVTGGVQFNKANRGFVKKTSEL